MDKVKMISVNIKYLLSIEMVLYLFAFLIPFTLNGPQLLTGSVVNAILYTAALKLNKKNLLILIVLPSLGALAHGVVFGPLTFYLFYFLPFIWIGNIILIGIFRQNKMISLIWLRILLASAIKAGFLYFVAKIYFVFHTIPSLFVTSMGMIQFITAILGGTSALILLKLNILKLNERNI